MKISQKELQNIIKESIKKHLLNEAKTLVDNFDEAAQFIDSTAQRLNDPDKFWYIEVKKRYKDNPGLHSAIKNNPTLNYDGYGLYIGNFKVYNGQELLNLKKQIVDLCNKNNARAYFTLNPRSDIAVQRHISSPHFQNYFKNKVSPNAKPEYVSSGRAASFFDKGGNMISRQDVINNYGSDRPVFMFDIDEKDERLWDLTLSVLKYFNIEILKTKKTPSGGLHVICSNAFDKNLPRALEILRISNGVRVTNGQKDYFPKPNSEQERRRQVIGCDFDSKGLLYSNVDTKGY